MLLRLVMDPSLRPMQRTREPSRERPKNPEGLYGAAISVDRKIEEIDRFHIPRDEREGVIVIA
jgi:hypothetical protein